MRDPLILSSVISLLNKLIRFNQYFVLNCVLYPSLQLELARNS